MAKDWIVIEPEDSVLLRPTENQLKRFPGIGELGLAIVSATIASEIIG